MYFVFHGSLDNNKSIGTNTLIKEFAQMAMSPEDIIIKYPFLHKIQNTENNFMDKQNLIGDFAQEEEIYDVKKEYQEIYKIITKHPIDIEDIIKNTNRNQKEIISKLTMLELEGKIRKLAGNRYIRCD